MSVASKRLVHARRLIGAAACTAALSMTSMGCTSDGGDLVFLRLFNGYAGGTGETQANSITVIGPNGPINDDAALFGAIVPDLLSEDPIEFDRSNYAGELTVLQDGVPGALSIQIDLFAMYPQETATLFFSRRSDIQNTVANLLRHHLITTDGDGADCGVQIFNGLSLNNRFTPNDLFSFMTEWQLPEATWGTFLYPPLTEIPTPCGNIDASDPVDQMRLPGLASIASQRQQIIDAEVRNDPFFFPVIDQNTNALTFRVGRWVVDTSVFGVPSTAEFAACVSQAIQPPQDQDTMGMTGSNECAEENGEQSIPIVDGQYALVINNQSLQNCFARTQYEGIRYDPDAVETFTIFHNGGFDTNAPNTCNVVMRLRTAGIDAIFDPDPDFTVGQGNLVRARAEHPLGTYNHVVIYGRPVAPLIQQITGARDTSNFANVTYPDGTRPPEAGVIRERPAEEGFGQ